MTPEIEAILGENIQCMAVMREKLKEEMDRCTEITHSFLLQGASGEKHVLNSGKYIALKEINEWLDVLETRRAKNSQ